MNLISGPAWRGFSKIPNQGVYMRIECPNCLFSADTDKVPSGKVKVKCPKCGERFHLSPPEDDPFKMNATAPGEPDVVPGPDLSALPGPGEISTDNAPELPPALGVDSRPLDMPQDPGPLLSNNEPELPPAIGVDSGPLDLAPEIGDPGQSLSGSEPELPPAMGFRVRLDQSPEIGDPVQSLGGNEPELPPAIGLDSDVSGPSSLGDTGLEPPAAGPGLNTPPSESPEPGQLTGLDPADLTLTPDQTSASTMPGLELASDFVDSNTYEQAPDMPDGMGGIGLDSGAPALRVHEGTGNMMEPQGGGGDFGPLPSHSLLFHGKGKTLLGIYVVNVLLTIVTLGIFYCWAKVKTRKYLYSSTELMRGRFTFTGTGRELFVGRVKATGLMIVLFGGPQVLATNVHEALAFLVIPAMLLLAPVARVSAMRYRYCRTLWHNVQFSFRGTVKEGLKIYLVGTLLTIVTLGFYYPFFYADKQAFFRNNTQFGSESFSYDGQGKELFGTFFLGLLLTPLTLGLWWFWLKARLLRYDWEHTSFQGVRFSSTVTGGNLIALKLVNLLILALTLGLGYPWVVIRNMEFNFRHLKMEGRANLSKIFQTKENAQAVGEGLLDQLDMDFAI
jgi:predicted Zn finger-like uncharacterized protein